MVRPRGIPEDLGPDTTQRIARTFLLVRMVRGGLLLLFLAIAFVAVEARNWPSGVAVAVALAALLQAGALAASCWRYTRAVRRPDGEGLPRRGHGHPGRPDV